jgi:hypothetical protein
MVQLWSLIYLTLFKLINVTLGQGDQNPEKIAQNVAQDIFCQN